MRLIAWLKLLYERWKNRHLEGFKKEVCDILSNSIEILNEKGYRTVGKRYDCDTIDKGFRIRIHFGHEMRLIPIIPSNASLRDCISEQTLFVSVNEPILSALREAALDIFVWTCFLPRVGSEQYYKLVKEGDYHVISR